MTDEILTTNEVRREFKLGRTTMWHLVKTGQLPAYRIGDGKTSAFRYKRSDVMAWLDGRRVVVKKKRATKRRKGGR